MTTENYGGTNCTGVDGAINRTLTLSNTDTTIDDGLEIFVNGLFLHPLIDFTISHLSASSMITFLNAMFNEQIITINYQVIGIAGEGIGDSVKIPLDTQLLINEIDYLGDTITVRLITESYSDYGDPTSQTNSDTTSVKALVSDISPEESRNLEVRFQEAEKRFLIKQNQGSIAIGNRLVHQDIVYEIVRVINYTMNDITLCKEAWGKVI